jgi:hypothetical protein
MTDLIMDTATEKTLRSVNPAAFRPTSDMELSEEYLTRRFERPTRRTGEVVYELTSDAGYLHQYYRLREEMFINVWGLKQFSGHEDAFDAKSDIMIARIGNHCIGGCRLTFANPAKKLGLPMEKEDFTIGGHVKLPLKDVTYVEISRMAILPEFQNSLVMLELSRQLLKRGAEKKARYAFTLAPVPLSRNYRKAASLFGLKWNIRYDIAVPDREEYEGIKMVLSVLDLAPTYRNKNQQPLMDINSDVTLIAG